MDVLFVPALKPRRSKRPVRESLAAAHVIAWHASPGIRRIQIMTDSVGPRFVHGPRATRITGSVIVPGEARKTRRYSAGGAA